MDKSAFPQLPGRMLRLVAPSAPGKGPREKISRENRA